MCMRKLERTFDFILDSFAVIAAVLLVVMMLATVLKVVLRAVFNHGMLGIDQISGTMMVYITFLGAAWVLRRDSHVSVDILIANLRPRVQRAVMFVSSLVGAAVCFVLAWFGTNAVLLSLQRGILVAPKLKSRGPSISGDPAGCLLLGIEFLRAPPLSQW